MTRSLAPLVGAIAVLVGACSAGTEPLQMPPPRGNGGASSGGGGSSAASGGASSAPGSSSSPGGASSSAGAPDAGLAPPPASGPGSASSPAHQYFDATVYPELAATCATCHASGASGAPIMMAAPAGTTYSQLDALGLIQPNSALVTKGAHANGAAPALTTQEQTDVTHWLGLEAQERTGANAPTSVLSQVAQCASEADWKAIGWDKLRTQPRNNESTNKCSGCAYALCASCHAGGEQGFFMDMGTSFDTDGSIAFQQTFHGPSSSAYVIQFFGLNGTTPVASNAIVAKQQAVATAPAYTHPMFVLSASMQAALTTFVNDAITSYTSGACKPKAGDAGQ